jgi:hypothetical protein
MLYPRDHIEIETPPPSPPALIPISPETAEWPDGGVSALTILPIAQQRYRTAGTTRKRKRVPDSTIPDEAQPPTTRYSPEKDILAGIHPTAEMTASNTLPEDIDDDYSAYVEAVLANAVPFYQITKNLFVVDGNYSKKNSNVCKLELLV